MTIEELLVASDNHEMILEVTCNSFLYKWQTLTLLLTKPLFNRCSTNYLETPLKPLISARCILLRSKIGRCEQK